MKIFMACPASPRSRKGNRVTALRWARILQNLGHHVTIGREYTQQRCNLLVALHARRSYPSIRTFRRLFAQAPLIVALTGTDLYRDIRTSKHAQQSLQLADRLIVLQPCGVDELPAAVRGKARVIYQSVTPRHKRRGDMRKAGNPTFDVCVLGHLRHEKDPLRAALALRLLPASSAVRVTHAGQALSPALAHRARVAMAGDPRYRWLGEVPRWRARRLLARSHALVLSSRMEGGANVVSEALAEGVPVLASHIPGNVGLLGAGYPGYYPVGDTPALARLLNRAASDVAFYGQLVQWCAGLKPLVEPARERQAWNNLLRELVVPWAGVPAHHAQCSEPIPKRGQDS
jgi:putative glycosyltransferase (TIGR04348 family)